MYPVAHTLLQRQCDKYLDVIMAYYRINTKNYNNIYKIQIENISFILREKVELFVISYHVSSSYMMPPSFAKRKAKNL